jgi:hypothetical protein
MKEPAVSHHPALPVVVIGAGPVGLAAAAHLLERGQTTIVLEAGERPAAGVRGWAHVRLFSAWGQIVDEAARRLLEPTGWTAPDASAYPTGGEWAAGYLDPLAAALGDTVRLRHRVTGITRDGVDRLSDAGRDATPFAVLVDTPDGPQRLLARAVLDASGSTGTPNPLGADGLPAAGEAAAAERVDRGIPDLADPDVRARHAGRHTAVLGAGHSAQTAVLALADLAAEEPGTTVTWVLRRHLDPIRVGGGAADQLPRRGALGLAAQRAADEGRITVVEGFRPAAVEPSAAGVALVALDGRRIEGLDRLVGLTGFRPDLTLEAELRLDLDPATQAPRALGPLIDPNVHSCGTVPPHGEAELRHPERDLYLVGMKAYGRAPTFLALTGYEQVRSVAAHLAGDHEAARRVDLRLPETGVCSGAGLVDAGLVDAGLVEAGLVDGGLPLVGAGDAATGCC